MGLPTGDEKECLILAPDVIRGIIDVSGVLRL